MCPSPGPGRLHPSELLEDSLLAVRVLPPASPGLDNSWARPRIWPSSVLDKMWWGSIGWGEMLRAGVSSSIRWR